ncbi:MAG TPA: DUF3368 domain-containing protein [Chthonomonadaceae bacterium]|nr:DUF3368 domain-containing protein [Chthonomonadaceae bacterium]
MSERWIVNASPVIVLAKAGHLNLLTDLAAEILLPETVATEILAGNADDPARQTVEAGWGNRMSVAAIPATVQALNLDPGETAVLALALEQGGCTVVLDDGKARVAARSLGLSVIGTLGVVLRAKNEGNIPAAVPILHDLRAVGLYLDEALIQAAMKSIGENWP